MKQAAFCILSIVSCISFGMERVSFRFPIKKRQWQKNKIITEATVRNSITDLWEKGESARACFKMVGAIKKWNLYPTKEESKDIITHIESLEELYSSDAELRYLLCEKYNL